MIATSAKMKELLNIVMRVAGVDSTVLIQGESGVGKELIAEIIHSGSSRRDGPFIKVNCGAIPENLLESELFGYEEGAFTGARKNGKIGLFELANNGILFLDEIEKVYYREDLYYRLNVVPIEVPPLRERKKRFRSWRPILSRYSIRSIKWRKNFHPR